VSACFGTALFFAAILTVSLWKAPRFGFALAWVLCTLLPVLNVSALPFAAKENYLYLPSIGFCLLFVIAYGCVPPRYRAVVVFFSVIAALFYMAQTLQRNREYRDPIVFLEHTLQDMKKVDTADRHDVRYYQATKNFFTTYRNLGRIHLQRGELEKAARAFEQALRYAPPYFSPRYAEDAAVSLGRIYEKTGRYERAAAVLSAVLPNAVRPARVHNLLGVIAVRRSDFSAAHMHFEKAIQLRPGYAPAHYNRGLLYLNRGNRTLALQEFNTAARLDPRYRVPDMLQNRERGAEGS
jgi:tetratricopeptide (TPR) repeat protein